MAISCCHLAKSIYSSESDLACNLVLLASLGQPRNLLRRRPLVLHRQDGTIFRIGGKGQCNQDMLRRVCARLHNWTELVRDVIKAELPSFEVCTAMSTLLQLGASPARANMSNAAKRMGHVLDVPPVAQQRSSKFPNPLNPFRPSRRSQKPFRNQSHS